MKKMVEVRIEETLVKTIQVEVPNNLSIEDRMEYAENKAHEMYENEEIVLTADDFSGNTMCSVHDLESDIESDWHTF